MAKEKFQVLNSPQEAEAANRQSQDSKRIRIEYHQSLIKQQEQECPIVTEEALSYFDSWIAAREEETGSEDQKRRIEELVSMKEGLYERYSQEERRVFEAVFVISVIIYKLENPQVDNMETTDPNLYVRVNDLSV